MLPLDALVSDLGLLCRFKNVWADVDLKSAAWASVRTERREFLPLKPLCVGNMTARPKLRGELKLSTLYRTFLHVQAWRSNPSTIIVHTKGSVCVCWSPEKLQKPDHPGPEPSCVSFKSNRSKDGIINFKGQPPSAANRLADNIYIVFYLVKLYEFVLYFQHHSAGTHNYTPTYESCPMEPIFNSWFQFNIFSHSSTTYTFMSGKNIWFNVVIISLTQRTFTLHLYVCEEVTWTYFPCFLHRVGQENFEVPGGQRVQQDQITLDSIFKVCTCTATTFTSIQFTVTFMMQFLDQWIARLSDVDLMFSPMCYGPAAFKDE